MSLAVKHKSYYVVMLSLDVNVVQDGKHSAYFEVSVSRDPIMNVEKKKEKELFLKMLFTKLIIHYLSIRVYLYNNYQ